jgi:hypothetical protein
VRGWLDKILPQQQPARVLGLAMTLPQNSKLAFFNGFNQRSFVACHVSES